jgi:glutamine amidotransferase
MLWQHCANCNWWTSFVVPRILVNRFWAFVSERSSEFGDHEGLGLLAGDVVALDHDWQKEKDNPKVPHVGWSRIENALPWGESLLEGLSSGAYMYFVHSFYVRPADPKVILSNTRYGHTTFCSSLMDRNIFACQFHPERSGQSGLHIYKNFARRINAVTAEKK